ncbi:MAG: chlorite dismutase family protein [Dehalococcoidia bacterium]
MSGDRTNGQPSGPPATRQYVQFIFYKANASWRALSTDDREAIKDEAVAAVEAFSSEMQVRAYSLVGVRGDADFMFWHISDDLSPFQQAATALLSTRLGPYLSTPYAYLALTRKSQYADKTEAGAAASRRLRLKPGTAKYLFVYPFVKTRAWYNLPQEERQAMMDDHIRIGRKYPSVKLNTTYSFGIDDQEFVVAFETDEPGDFLDLVMELRETKSSLYTVRDTPAFTCVATTVRGALDAIGGAGARIERPDEAADGAWTRVCDAAELPAGARRVVYFRAEQVALLNVDETVYAIEARCPHANGPLVDGGVEGTALTCPSHGSRFDLARGCEVVQGPAVRPARCYAVRVEGGGVFLAEAAAVR